MNNIISEIQKSNNIVLLCHKNPDGDAIGSTIAMYHLLKKLNKEVDMVIKDAPSRFSFINGYSSIKSSSNKKYNLGIVLDTAIKEKINNPNNIITNIEKIMVIDHHQSNKYYGDINHVDVYPACCEVIYNLIKEMNIEIDDLLAMPLSAGLLTDTGGLSHPDVKPSTYQMVAELSKIIDIPTIYKMVLGTITKGQFELKKRGIENLEFYKDGQITFTYITEEDLNRLNLPKSEADILAGLGRDIEGVEVSIFIRKYKEENRVSLRSNNIDVNEVAKIFGCGGHKNAAGITTTTEFNILKAKLIEEVGKKIDEWHISSK